MLQTPRARNGMVVAPHFLAAEAGRDVLRDGGSAVEAMVAAAAAIAVVYPHMNAIGGDGFWLIGNDGAAPLGIDACGPTAAAADRAFYDARGHASAIPARGPHAALTVPGTVAGWQRALASPGSGAGRLPLARLLEPAIRHARDGVPASTGLARLAADKRGELEDVPGFADTFLAGGAPPETGAVFRQPRLADTLEQLARAGLDDFYRGEIAAALADDLAAMDSPVDRGDLAGFDAMTVDPLGLDLGGGRVYNMPPPTQGLASLLILGIFERLGVERAEGFAHVHGLVEATKQAFQVRDRYVTDPAFMDRDPCGFLDAAFLDGAAARISAERALPWPQAGAPGDTVWLGAMDRDGRSVSFIQSIYWEFGAGVVSPATGVLMQNRGMSFSLDPAGRQALQPGRRPFHTLNPAMARLNDGRTLVYGTMGGEGQPQTQAAVFSRHVLFGQALQDAVTAPRWLLGRTWGSTSTSLKFESRFEPALIEAMAAAGHDVEVLGPFEDAMGHAGAISRRADGVFEGAADPRSDGQVAAL
ncbi:gamma-glutamyltransferase family protein [Aquisalimonas lutea]|uniref:gamma-glutamyltransferase family protein n=1 Tax=Aquisalimonas lutea TaxID=1327750 RepID=UPI0025B5FB06|nr:gamma-glutamyltransferase family protein [Aquisalimonas lutea]MDN3518585.1 gamma-glutamyltransferase family protein [Aquisalimonas lutea]